MAKPATLDGYSDQYTIDCERVLVTRVAPVSDAALGLPAGTRRYWRMAAENTNCVRDLTGTGGLASGHSALACPSP